MRLALNLGLAVVVAIGVAGAALAADRSSTVLSPVTVTAPAPVSPNAAPREVLPMAQNPYEGRNRVEEDRFVELPCGETRIASTAGGKCLSGYHLTATT